MKRDERTSFIGPAGVMAIACTHRRPDATREAPAVILIRINWQLARDRAGPCGVAERFAVPRKPANAWWREGASVKDGRNKQRRTWGLTMSLATPRCVQKLQAASHGTSCVFSESRMREICQSGSMSGNRKQSYAKPD